MKSFLYACLMTLFATSCAKSSRWDEPVHPSQIVSYPTRDNQFVILAVEDRGVGSAQAKDAAMRKAAQVTLDNGYHYFIVDSEDEIQVMKAPPSESYEDPARVYQELPAGKGQANNQDTLPAIRLLIDCFTQKPAMINSIDAQKYLSK